MTCKWYPVCPLRRLEARGLLDDKWATEYCTSEDNWKYCKRYQLEDQGAPHPDNLLPDGTYLPE